MNFRNLLCFLYFIFNQNRCFFFIVHDHIITEEIYYIQYENFRSDLACQIFIRYIIIQYPTVYTTFFLVCSIVSNV